MIVPLWSLIAGIISKFPFRFSHTCRTQISSCMYVCVIFYLLLQSMVLLAALCILLPHAVHTLWGKLEFFVHTAVLQSISCSVACNKLECQKEVVVAY